MIQNFRPGVMERLGLGPADCATLNPRLVYGVVTEICVRHALKGLLATGKPVTLLADATKELDPAAARQTLAEFTAATLAVSVRSSADGTHRQSGNGAKMRLDTAGKMRFRCFWITSSSDCRVLTSAPKARPATASTVKRIRSACRSMVLPLRAAAAQRPARRSATRCSCGW